MTQRSRRALTPDDKVWVDGDLVTVVASIAEDDQGVECVLEFPGGRMARRKLIWADLDAALVPANDGGGDPQRAITSLWGKWMEWSVPRIRSAVLATKPLRPYAHQDTAVFGRMLPQPRLRFLLADEPGTGKTIMTGMYLSEGRRRGLVQGKAIIVVPAHLVTKWIRDLERYFGITAMQVTSEVGRTPQPLRPDIDVWLVSVDLYTYNTDVRRKVAGRDASWSIAVFDEAHRLTPTSQYLGAAQQIAEAAHHLLLLTATPHRGNEHFWRALLNILDPDLYPWDQSNDDYGETRLHPSDLHFLRRMKEDLRDLDGSLLFPPRRAHTVRVDLSGMESDAYNAVMAYVDQWYSQRATLARSIYGKRAASSLQAAYETLGRRHQALSGTKPVGVEPLVPTGFDDPAFADAPLDDDAAWEEAEEAVVASRSKNRKVELEAVEAVMARLRLVLDSPHPPTKWTATEKVLAHHDISPGQGQVLVFTEFVDTARWLRELFVKAGYSTEVLEGGTDPQARDDLQQRFLSGDFEVLVSTDAGGEGIDLQSAHVMLDWDIPWSLVRLEQRMGRLHRIGQLNPVDIYHLVAPVTREGRVQEVILKNFEAAGEALKGRIFDLLDATASGLDLDYAKLLAQAQQSGADADEALAYVPDTDALVAKAREIAREEDRFKTPENLDEARERYALDRMEAINPVMVEGFVRQLARTEGWTVSHGPHAGLLMISAATGSTLPAELGADRQCLLSADGQAVRAAWESGVDVEGVVVLGPSELAFAGLVTRAAAGLEGELRRGTVASDPGSGSNYLLFAYQADVETHDGLRSERRPYPFLVRYSGAEAFKVEWESVMTLVPCGSGTVTKPTPAARAVAAEVASTAVAEERTQLVAERTGWVTKARADLEDIEARYLRQIRTYPDEVRAQLRAGFASQKAARLAQLDKVSAVTLTPAKLLGWVDVSGTATLADLGFDPDSEKVAVAVVMGELAANGFEIDDRQTAGVGYDLYARHRHTGEQRLVEVKGQLGHVGPVTLESNEWAQAQQRGGEYWLYLVVECGSTPTVFGRFRDPAAVFGGPKVIERIQISTSKLKNAVEAP